jgi:hypothetical protein
VRREKICSLQDKGGGRVFGRESWPEMTGLRNERKFAVGRSER